MKSSTKAKFKKFLEESSSSIAQKIMKEREEIEKNPIYWLIIDFKAEANRYLEKEFELKKSFYEISAHSADKERVFDFAESMADANLTEFCKQRVKRDVEVFLPKQDEDLKRSVSEIIKYEEKLLKMGEGGDKEGRGLVLVEVYLEHLKEVFVQKLNRKPKEQEVKSESV